MNMARSCATCKGRILQHSIHIKCSICGAIFHRNCLPYFTNDDIQHLSTSSDWICCCCSVSIFPFNHIEDDIEFTNVLAETWFFNDMYTIEDLNSRLFTPFEIDKAHNDIAIDDFDPDLNFFKDLKVSADTSTYYSEDKFNTFISTQNIGASVPLSFLHLNIRSVPKNIDKLESYLHTLDFKFPIIGLSETWYNDNTSCLYGLDEYNQESVYRTNQRGGGVSLLVDKNISYSVRHDFNIFDSNAESCFIEISKDIFKTERNVIVGIIYRIPDRDALSFNQALNIVLGKIKHENKIAYILGDYNLNLFNIDSHAPTGEFLDICFSNNFIPLINKPTRVTKHSATLIDNILTNNIINVSYNSGLFLTDISDHFPIFTIHKNIWQHDTQITYRKRIINSINIERFKQALHDHNLNSILNISDVNIATSTFHNEFTTVYNKCFPIKVYKRKYSANKPWLSNGIKESIKRKNYLYKVFLKSPSNENLNVYKQYRNKLHSLIRKAEREHYYNLLLVNKNNLKKTWGIMKNVINKKKQSLKPDYFLHNSNKITDKKEIATRFNDFFINIGNSLASKIPSSNKSAESFLTGKFSKSLFLSPVTNNEVINILKQLKSNSSPGWDDLSTMVVQASHVIILDVLVHIINLSLNQGIFPDILKIAKVIPLFKADDMNIFTNYRPISILSVFSKVFERVFYNRLYDFLNNEKILYDKQFGFRTKYSTEMALILLTDRISSALEKGEFVLGIFLDFSKAFDTVNHEILLKKLNHYGVRGIANDWVSSYLDSRPQFVVYDSVKSANKYIDCGVPQGSILGPLLFLLYINDLAKISNSLFFLMYADDTNVFISGKNLKELETQINKDLISLTEWLNTNKLSLNINKTHYMIFNPPRIKPNCRLHIHINNVEIHSVEQTKFLGVIIDCHLSWKPHIQYIKTKVCKSIGIITKARKYLDSKSLQCLYYAFLYPYFVYAITVWGGTNITSLSPLIKVQKWALRAISNKSRRFPSAPLFESFKMLNINQIYRLQVLAFVYKYNASCLPDVFHNFFTKTSDIHSYSTRQQFNFYPTRCKYDLTKSLVRYSGTILWNGLDNEFKLCVGSVSSFKRQITKSWFT